MNREYHKWRSKHLKREMELLIFGHAGAPVLFFLHVLPVFMIMKTGESLMHLKKKLKLATYRYIVLTVQI